MAIFRREEPVQVVVDQERFRQIRDEAAAMVAELDTVVERAKEALRQMQVGTYEMGKAAEKLNRDIEKLKALQRRPIIRNS